jgi:hypothetical protein
MQPLTYRLRNALTPLKQRLVISERNRVQELRTAATVADVVNNVCMSL